MFDARVLYNLSLMLNRSVSTIVAAKKLSLLLIDWVDVVNRRNNQGKLVRDWVTMGVYNEEMTRWVNELMQLRREVAVRRSCEV